MEEYLCDFIAVLWGSTERIKSQTMTHSVNGKWRHHKAVKEELVTGKLFPAGLKHRIVKITNCVRPSLKLGD